MSITIVQKSSLSRVRRGVTKALVLAGGAVTGGAFEAGGVKALNDYFTNFNVTNFDIYVGISSGSLIAAPLVAGLSPETILKTFYGTSHHFTRMRAWHYYRLNMLEWITRPIGFFKRVLGASFEYLLKGEFDIPSILSALPTGLFDNKALETYFRKNIERNNLTNDFNLTQRLSGKKLYICATGLDDAKLVIFGPDEKNDVTISKAIQASTAMPGFYKPVNIDGVDYVDGDVRGSAPIEVAVNKGADLIVCYNPFRPYDVSQLDKYVRQKQHEGWDKSRLAEKGFAAVIVQMFRVFLHTHFHVALDHFRRDPKFKGDIILIEPRPDDIAFYALNPLYLSNCVEATRLGFESVRNSIEERYEDIKRIFAAYGISMSRENVEKEFEKIASPEAKEGEIRATLETKKRKSA